MFIPSQIWWGALYGLLAGVRKGLFLCDAEALACDLLGELLVKVVVFLFKCGGIEAVGEHRSPAHDVGASLKLLGSLLQHLAFDDVAERFGLGLGFFHDGFPFLQGFDFGDQFVSRHCFVSFLL